MGFFSKKRPSEAGPADVPAASGAAAPAGGVLDVLRATVSRLSRDHLAPESLDVRSHLLDSGYIDSLSATELLTTIERQYGVRIEEMDLVGRLCNLEALAREIEARSAGQPK